MAVAGGLETGAAPGDARRSECRDLGDAVGTGGPGAPSALGWGVGGRPDGPGSLGSRERCPCLESPCAGIARFRDEWTISEDPGHLGGVECSLARSRGHGKLRAGRGLLDIPEVKQEGVRVPETTVCLRSPWGDRALPLSLPGRNRLGGCGWGRERARGDQRLYWGFCFAQRGAVTVPDGPQSFSGRRGE